MVKVNLPLEYLKLFRLQTGATTALAPIFGYLVLTAQYKLEIDLIQLILIFIIGILMHIFEFVLNEYVDLEVDKRSPDLTEKPLVKGSVSKQAAITVVFGALFFTYFITIFYFFNLWTILLLSLSFVFGAIYDINGKQFAGSDFTLALWIFFFCLFGASIVSIEFTPTLYLVAGLGFFQILFNNAIEGGLKDADHDALAGAHTLAHSLGVHVEKGRVIIPITFKVASYAIKLGHMVLIYTLLYVSILKVTNIFDYLHFVIILILIAIIFGTLHIFLNQTKFDRDKFKRIFSLHEIATFYIAPILLLQLIGFFSVLFLLLLPLVWYMVLNLVLYGKPLEPKV